MANDSEQGRATSAQPPKTIVLYTCCLCVTTFLAFLWLLWWLSSASAAAGSAETPAVPGSSHVILVVVSMFVAGGLGACLYSFRGLIKHSSENDYSEHYNLWYYLSPLVGGTCGVIVFFLLLGGALTLNISDTGSQSFRGITGFGLAPYLALSLLAGYASRDFMAKMKDLAESLFARSNG